MSFDPIAVLGALARNRVEYLVIGGVAATLHGSPLTTGDLDICPADAPANLDRLAKALAEVGARIRTAGEPDGVALPVDGALLGQADTWNLTTRHGPVDLVFSPVGTFGYDDLKRDAVTFRIDDLDVPTASLGDVIRSKEAAGRERDRAALPTLRRLLEGLRG